jgi:uncharacterized protein
MDFGGCDSRKTECNLVRRVPMITITHRKITASIVIVIQSLFLSFNVLAESVQNKLDAVTAAYKKKEYKTAFDLFQKLANTGNAFAQNKLGVMYEEGYGIKQDYIQAVLWYRKAADQEDATAQNNLGALYIKGQGVPQDTAQAPHCGTAKTQHRETQQHKKILTQS